MKTYILLLLLVTFVYSFNVESLSGKDRQAYGRLLNSHAYRRGSSDSGTGTDDDDDRRQQIRETEGTRVTDNRLVSGESTLFADCETDADCNAVTTNTVCAEIFPANEEDEIFKMCICPSHLICVTPASLEDDCNLSLECSEATPNSVCDPLTLLCTCDEGYVNIGGECVKSATLGEACQTDEMCQVTDQKSVCDDTLGRCVCMNPLLLVSGACVYCPLGMYFCHQNSNCISQYLVCDGNNDCTDGMDEVMCDTCTTSEFVCISGGCADRTAVCNGTSECSDGSDELTNACPP